jgi:hypothetical protein
MSMCRRNVRLGVDWRSEALIGDVNRAIISVACEGEKGVQSELKGVIWW